MDTEIPSVPAIYYADSINESVEVELNASIRLAMHFLVIVSDRVIWGNLKMEHLFEYLMKPFLLPRKSMYLPLHYSLFYH
jgi:hypothetical protein